MKKVFAEDLVKYSLKIGFNYLKNCRGIVLKEGIKRLVIPMDICRYFEIPETINQLSPKRGEKILDLSSPKLTSLYIAENFNSEVFAVDVYKAEIENWRRLIEMIDSSKRRFKHLKLTVADGRKLPYKDNFFDKIFSISVLEHIPDNGDKKTILELVRVLKPGGTLVFSVTFAKIYREEFLKQDIYGTKFNGKIPVLFQRIYDEKKLKERIIQTSKLKVIKKIICGEKYPLITEAYGRFLPFSVIFGLAFPFLAKISLKKNSKEILESNIVLLKMKKI